MSTVAGVADSPSQEFGAWLADTLRELASVASDSSDIDVPSLVDYLSGVLAADAAEGTEAQEESVRDIVQEFGLLSLPAAGDANTLASRIVEAFNRCNAAAAGAAAASSSASAELTAAEAEALARVREMTIKQQQQLQHQSPHPADLGANGEDAERRRSEKQLILRAYANVSDSDDEADNGGGICGADSGGPAINNRAATEGEEKLKRERMRLEHAHKQERDKADREKQRNAKEARKEAEKKRTQKQERRK